MDIINELKGKSLSSRELLKLVNYKANLITYPELKKYKSIDEALGKYNCLIILYLTKKNYGHWCCIYKLKSDLLHFFDSYGIIPDDELNFIDENMRIELNQRLPHLTMLIYKSKYALDYNDYKLQKRKNGIATCGRHVATRIYFKNMNIEEYVKMIIDSKLEPDTFVTLFTYKLSNNNI